MPSQRQEINLLVFLFLVLLFQSQHQFELDSTILIISFIYSFEIYNVNPISALTSPLPLIFLSSTSIPDEIVLVANLGKTSLAKEKSKYIRAFLR